MYAEAVGGASSLQARELREVAGVAGIIVFSVLVAGAVAILSARTTLVPGSLAVAVGVPSLALVTLSPSLAALLATTALSTAWVLTVVVTRDVAWSRELLTGSIGSAAAAGYLVGWLVQNGGTRAAS